nr:polcalcin Nic T 1 [Ipomoea batatas]
MSSSSPPTIRSGPISTANRLDRKSMKHCSTLGCFSIQFNQSTEQNHRSQLRCTRPAMADDPQDIADREKIFTRFDTNGDGRISAAELGETLKTLGSVTEDEVKNMMSEIDTDGDGFISFEEFTEFARANRGLIKDVVKIF